MAGEKTMRLSQVARKLNIGTTTIVEHLATKGFDVDNKPNTKISMEQCNMLFKEFQSSADVKEEAEELNIGKKHSRNVVIDADIEEAPQKRDAQDEEIIIKNLGNTKASVEETSPASSPAPEKEEVISATEKVKLQGIKVVGKINLKGEEETAPVKEEVKAPVAEKKEIPKPEKIEEKPVEKAIDKPVETPSSKVKEAVKEAPVTIEKKEEVKPVPKAEKKPVTKPTEKPAAPTNASTKDVKKPVEAKDKPKQQQQPKDKPKQQNVPPSKEMTPKATEKPKGSTEEKSKTTPPVEGNKKDSTIQAKAETLKGLTVLGKIELPKKADKKKDSSGKGDDSHSKKRKRKRVRIDKPVDINKSDKGKTDQKKSGPGGNNNNRGGGPNRGGNNRGPGNRGGGGRAGGNRRGAQRGAPNKKEEISQKEIQEKIKATLARMGGGSQKSDNRAKYRKEKRSAQAEAREEELLQQEEDAKILKVTEFISANDLASLLNISVNDIISMCMSLGMFVSINQRLDAETISLIAEEFGYKVDFTSNEDEDIQNDLVEEDETKLVHRAPVVTIMGHVDHGKTSLLDYIRRANVADKEAGGITQHIGAYSVETQTGKRVAFLDTPGHEAFTAMRARGAKLTDIVILVVAADDSVMPQTKEAINHAQQADVPIIIAINKVDKPNANTHKIREELANLNVLVEDWGGKYQVQEVSAKTGAGIDELLEKVLLEAEILELKANPERTAIGTVVEASLDKGRGYLTTLLVQAGTLKIGDIVVAGAHHGRVKAMTNHLGKRQDTATPSTPVQMLGLDGAPQAGDKFFIAETEREARETTTKRQQLIREQQVRTKKHLTLDEIGRRLAIGNFKELNLIIKGDVDGSVEALSDSLLKLSTDEVQVNIIHKAVGQISESDVLLATASDAIIIGFQVRPSPSARNLAEKEEIEIRLYSIIYKAIEEMKDAMEGLLEPTVEEVITGNIEIREVFKISKVGTVAGCYVTEGYVKRANNIRIIREGVVVFEGEIGALKRFKDDVSEVKYSYECGLSIKNYNDIKVGDIIESYEEREIKRKL